FRRSTVQIRNPGGLWDAAMGIYGLMPGAEPYQQPLEWRFPRGGKVKFAHLENDSTVLDWQGAEIPLIGFDELTHFTAQQFWYLLSRNRSMCGVRPYIRATTNPDADSWVAGLIAWWMNQETGLPIHERAGVIRWFIRVNNQLVWGDKPGDLPEQIAPDGQLVPPKSLTFIPAKLSDNAALMAADPGYYSNLMALTLVERERLLGGNWKIRPAAGLYFQRTWCKMVEAAPARLIMCRGWDIGATPFTGDNDPDYTCGTLIGVAPGREFYVLDQVWLRGTTNQVRDLLVNEANQDRAKYGGGVRISIPQDPAASGKVMVAYFMQALVGFRVEATPEARNMSDDKDSPSRLSAKITRFGPFSSQAEAGNVFVLNGEWNKRWFEELEGFPEARHDDSADSTSRAFAPIGTKALPMNITDADIQAMRRY